MEKKKKGGILLEKGERRLPLHWINNTLNYNSADLFVSTNSGAYVCMCPFSEESAQKEDS